MHTILSLFGSRFFSARCALAEKSICLSWRFVMSLVGPWIMAIPVVEYSRKGYKIRKVFGKKSTVLKWNYQILRIGVMASCQKLGISLVINGFKNRFYQKMSISTNVLLNWYSSMKKKFRKIPTIFDIENWLWKSNFGTFWQLPITPIFKIW